jgi:hypothetical protein
MEAHVRILAILALCAALAGCFSSDGPVFEEARGDCPFTHPTTFLEDDPNATTENRFVFERDGASCKITGPDGDVSHALFVPMGRNWWIIQGDESRPSYALIRRHGGRMTQYHPRCQEVAASRLRRLGIAFDEDRQNCTVTEARQIESAFRSWRGSFHRATGAYREVAP